MKRTIHTITLSIVLFTSIARADEDSPLKSPEAMAALEARAAAGEIAAIGELGAVLQNDKDPTNDIEGRDLLVRAADAGSWSSAWYLAQSYLYGWSEWALRDGAANIPEGLKWLRRAGETVPPDAVAQDAYILLGKIYSGFPVRGTWAITAPVDEAEAIKWYGLCAIERVPFCEWQLGRLLIGSPDTAAEGVKWLLNAANAGHEYAMSDLAKLYESGTVLKKDLEKALIWSERSVKWGLTVSNRTYFEAAARKKIAELSKQLTPEQVARAMETAKQFKPRTLSGP